MEKDKLTKKHDFIAISVFVVLLFLNGKYSAITYPVFSIDHIIAVITTFFIVYVIGIPLSFIMAKSHIISAQYFWRWANVIAILVMFLMLKGAAQ